MFPVLFRIPLPWGGPDTYFPIRMFGVMVILGFLLGQWVVARRLAKQKVMTKEETFDFCFYLLAIGIAGARLLYVLQEFESFRGHFPKIFAIWEGGLVWYGGMAASTLFAFWWLAKKKLPILRCADAAALGVAIALAVGRWGCFCAGDDYGRRIEKPESAPEHRVYVDDAKDAPWYAIQVPAPDAGWRWEIRRDEEGRGGNSYCETPENFRAPYWLHPVQLYMSFGNLVVFGCLLLIAKKAAKPGVVAASYLILYPVNRFVVEFWRGDDDRGVDVLGTGLSFSQAFGIPVVLVGIVVLRAALARPPEPGPSYPGA